MNRLVTTAARPFSMPMRVIASELQSRLTTMPVSKVAYELKSHLSAASVRRAACKLGDCLPVAPTRQAASKLKGDQLAASARQAAYTLGQVTWGFPQNAIGFAVFLAHAKRPHFRFHGAVVTTWESRKALSAGMFIFMHGSSDPATARDSIDRPLLVHEYGHTIQSLMLGPHYLTLIGLPSIIWMNVPAFSRRRARTGQSYYAFYTERWANHLGEKALKEPSIGLAMID